MSALVPYFQFRDFPAGITAAMQEALLHTFRQKQYVLGPEVNLFEQEFGTYLGAGSTAKGVGNGYDALVMSLKAAGIGAGDEVVVPSNSYMATVNAVLQTGARPVFAAPDQYTYNLTAASAEAVITQNTRAILPVHLFGQACVMAPLLQLAAKYKLHLIEDAAQAHGATYRGRQAGTFGFCNAFSFYPTKNLGALGDGGAVVTSSPEAAHFVQQYRNYGQAEKYVGEIAGINSRLDELQAAVLRKKLRHLDELNAERQRLAQVYLQELGQCGDLILPVTAPDCGHVYHIFNIRSKYRNELQAWLQNHGIGTAIHYPVPVHLQKAYRFLKYEKGDFPVAEELALTSLSLPLFPGLQAHEQQAVVQAVQQFYKRIKLRVKS